MTTTVVYVRCDSTLQARLDSTAERLGYSRNELAVIILRAGTIVLDRFTSPENALEQAMEPEFERLRAPQEEPGPDPGANDEPEQIHKGRTVAQAVAAEKRHLHRFTAMVPGTEHWGQGRRYATFECACGERKRSRAPK